ncbi:S41 family peptidase [Saccharicrinis sp. 156]|uniref:S41 family peptidase n=1 Tax=Saccharicrinis sp. 156 TaxID=3417574 RepID=UPI003D32F6EC
MRISGYSVKNILLLLAFLFVIVACEDDENEIEIEEEETIDPGVLKINSFVYENMSLYYLWEDKMPTLNISEEPDTWEYFDKLLYDEIDRWSFITDDVDELNNYFAGVRKEVGYSLRGYYFEEGSDRVVAFIEYVEPGGPADKAGLKRGDLIVEMNGAWITPDNYSDLFYSDQLNVGLGTVSDGEIYDLTPSVDVTAEEIQIDPILRNEVFTISGIKIGYLAYTSFIDEYNDDLEAVFSNFKAEGVSELILDLRYNGGGAVSTARLMASMICPASSAGELFLRSAYNDGLEEAIRNENPGTYTEWFEDYFETNSNNLDLSNLYVLTTGGTASASEMVIYSLSPYMNVFQIGEQTHGKYYGSITIEDEDGTHNWAIQPIIMRAENVDNSIDYSIGLIPDYEMYDDFRYELGDPDEVLTAFAISKITGSSTKAQELLKSAKTIDFIPSKEFLMKENPLRYEMYIDK